MKDYTGVLSRLRMPHPQVDNDVDSDGGVERRLARVWEGSAAWEASGLPRACPLGVRLDMEGGGAALVAPDALGPLKHLRQGQEVDTGCQDHPVLRPPDTQ